MANMRVHELAKELNITTKDINEVLGKEYKPMNGLTDEEAAIVRSRYSKQGAKAEKTKAESEKPEGAKGSAAKDGSAKTNAADSESAKPNAAKDTGKKADAAKQAETKAEAVKNEPQAEGVKAESNQSAKADDKKEEKKSHISQVFFPQNSSKGGNGENKHQNNQKNDGARQAGGHQSGSNSGNGSNGYRGDRNNNDRRNDRNNGYRDNRGERDNRSDRNGDNRGDRNNGDRNNRLSFAGSRNNGQGDRGGFRDGRGDNRGDRNNGGQGRNFGDRGGFRDGRGDNRGDRNNGGQGGRSFGDRNNGNQGGRSFGDRNNNGYRDNRGDRGFDKFSGDRDDRDSRSSGGQGRRNDRRDNSVKDEFIFEAKPDSRRPDSRKDKGKNDRKKDVEVKENLKFANSQQLKKPAKKEEKPEDTIRQLILPDVITVKELAEKMKVQPAALVKKLFMQGKIVTINQELDYDTAEEIALEFNCICDHEEKVDVIAEILKEDEENEEDLVQRPPVVCVMGHVDHGKTSLLDAIRETHVTAKESGGITQKIGAYTVDVNGNTITFLDTPGHEAFTAMRMRGAQSTDIAILVVAADDGVMPQTIEAINHAKAAGVEIIVAVNKIDKPSANVEKVKQELTEYELVAEDWGGSTIFVPVSAHTKQGINELLEMILLTAEVHELKANPNRKARGIVIEAELDRGRGPVATVLVQKGTLRVGDNVAAGACYGKIRAMINDKGEKVKEAGPSMPVEILGLNDVPNAGEIIMAVETDKEARSIAETFISEGRKKLLDDTKHKVSLDALFEQIQAGNVKELGLIIKADVQGSVEAVKQSLVKLSNEEVVVKVIHGGVGNINESDVVLASASNAIIIGFNVKPDNQARIVAEREKVDMRLYSVIYNAIEDVEAALKGMLEPVYEEQVIGHAEIRQIFKASGVGNIAGSLVVDGKVTKNATARIFREGDKIFEGPIATLKRFKDEVKEVKAGYECGLVFEKFNDIQEGDTVEAYEMVEVPR